MVMVMIRPEAFWASHVVPTYLHYYRRPPDIIPFAPKIESIVRDAISFRRCDGHVMDHKCICELSSVTSDQSYDLNFGSRSDPVRDINTPAPNGIGQSPDNLSGTMTTPPPYYTTFHLPPQVYVPCPEGPPYPCNTPPIDAPRPPSSATANTVTSAPISVPLTAQTFNTELGSKYGLQYEFHYSQCVGRKKVIPFL